MDLEFVTIYIKIHVRFVILWDFELKKKILMVALTSVKFYLQID